MIRLPKKKKKLCIEEPHFLYYNGFEIQVIPEQDKKTLLWRYRVCFYRHRNEKVRKRVFSDKTTFSRKTEAIKQGFVFGQKVIDGKSKKFSLKDIK
ncbi:MAG: hypothetical protein LHV68_10700 [Elusimicrobia bacterium]|nr:hypothetical protein [Candidatus Liberimonas magnetica]